MTDIHFHQDHSTSRGLGGSVALREILHPLESWINAPRVAEDFIASRPSVLRLLVLLLVTDAVFLGTMVLKMATLHVHPAVAIERFDLGFWVAIAFVGRTVFLVFLSNALCVLGTVAGSSATNRTTFTGVVWGATRAMRVALLSVLIAAAIAFLQPIVPGLDAKWVSVMPYLLSFCGFVWYVATGAASAHRIDPINSMVVATFLLGLVGWLGTVFVLGLKISMG